MKPQQVSHNKVLQNPAHFHKQIPNLENKAQVKQFWKIIISKADEDDVYNEQHQKGSKVVIIIDRQNDIAYLVGQKRSKLRTQPAGDSEMFEKSAHQTLIDIRKKYDSIKRERQIKFAHSQKLKEIAKSYAVKENQLKQKIRDCRVSSKRNKNWIQEINLQVQFKFTDRKVLEHMKQRLKNDIHFYQQRIIIRKKTLQDFKFNVKTLEIQCQKLHTQTGNSNNVLMKLKKNLDSEYQQRQQHLNHLLRMLDQKQTQEKNEKNRVLFEEEQAVKALLSKNEEQKNWQSLLLVHIFLKKILENKIKGQMQKFKITQQAFRNIKSNTDVKDAHSLTYKFLNRQRIYGELLTQVTKTKQKHSELKQQYLRLKEEEEQLQEENKELSNLEYTHIPKYKQIRNPELIEKQARQIKTMKIKMREWLLYQLNKIAKYQKRNEIKIYTKDPRITITQLFNIYLQYLQDLQLRSQVEGVNSVLALDTNNQEIFENASFISINQTTKMDTKNASTLFTSPDNEYILKFDIRQNQTDSYKTDQQIYALNQQRQQVHQVNQKFMKDLRIRHLQNKKKKI